MYLNDEKHHSTSYYNKDRGLSQYIDWSPDIPKMRKTVSEFTRNKSVEGVIIPRDRFNQPKGYSAYKYKPIYNYYAEKHNYQYYIEDWTYKGEKYKKGYYDENGNHYERIAFEQDGIYYDVECSCIYCGTKVKRNWKTGETLKCSKCGGRITILTPTDCYTQDPEYTYFKEVIEPEYTDIENISDMYRRVKSYNEDETITKKDDNVKIYHNIICKCKYCENISKKNWKEGTTLNCPTCGGELDIITSLDTFDKEYEKQDNTSYNLSLREIISSIILILFIIGMFLFIIISAVSM